MRGTGGGNTEIAAAVAEQEAPMNPYERMPIRFAMALSHDPVALSRFLRLDDSRQDQILARAREATGFLDVQELISGMMGTFDSQNP